MALSDKAKARLDVYRRIRNIVLTVIIGALTLIIVLIMIARTTGETPDILGYSMFRVSSGSMQPELDIGDVILTSDVDGRDVKEGDIVTYKSTSGSMSGNMVTHRVVKAPYKDGDEYYIVTKGDSNTSADNPITVSQVKSKLITKISILKIVFNIFVTPWGLLLVIGLIIFAFFNEIIIFVKALLGIGYEDDSHNNVEEIIEKYKKQSSQSESTDNKNDDT